MTPPTDPNLAESVGNWLVFAIGVGLTIWRRGKQNQALGDRIDVSLAAQVALIKTQVSRIESSLAVTQTLVGIHAERLKEGNQTASDLAGKLSELEIAVQKGDALVKQFNDYLERAKAGKLIEKPIEGSGGLVTLKKEE